MQLLFRINICDTTLFDCAYVPWSRNRIKGAMPSPKCPASDNSIGQIVNFQEKFSFINTNSSIEKYGCKKSSLNVTSSSRQETAYDIHPRAVISSAKFHVCISSNLVEITTNRHRDIIALYSIDIFFKVGSAIKSAVVFF